MSTTNADTRIVILNDAMNLVAQQKTIGPNWRLRDALKMLEIVKADLMRTLHHDRRISLPPSVVKDAAPQQPEPPPSMP